MFTILAIFGFFLTYTLIYRYALSKMLHDMTKPPVESATKGKPAAPIGHC